MVIVTERQKQAVRDYFQKLDSKHPNYFKYDKTSVKFFRSTDNDNLYVKYSYIEYVGGVVGQYNEIVEFDCSGISCEVSKMTNMGSCQRPYIDLCDSLIELKTIKIF